MDAELQQRIRDAAARLREHGATAVYLFGSSVRGPLRDDSDIDFAVTGLPARAKPAKPAKPKACKISLAVKWEEKGVPVAESGSMDGEELAKHKAKGAERVKKGSPAETYFKCQEMPPLGSGEHAGRGRAGTSNHNGFLWVFSGTKNAARKDLPPMTAHELGHNLAGGTYHSDDKDDIMYPIVESEADDGTPRQKVTNATACAVKNAFAADKMCEQCCK